MGVNIWKGMAVMGMTLALLVGCAGQGTQPAEEAATEQEAAAEGAGSSTAMTTGGDPWIDSDIVGNVTADMQTSATDDFHLYVNHDWLVNTKIPEGKMSTNAFQECEEQLNERIGELLSDTTIQNHDAELVHTFYDAIMDWDTRNAVGIEPLKALVKDVEQISSLDDLRSYVCDPERSVFTGPFVAMVCDVSYQDSTRYDTHLRISTLTLGDSAEYEQRTEFGDLTYDANLELAKKLLARIGYTEDEVQTLYESAIELEAKLAKGCPTKAQLNGSARIKLMNNPYTQKELTELCTTYPLMEQIEGFGYGASTNYNVLQPDAFKILDEIFVESNLEAMKALLIVRGTLNTASYLDEDAYLARVERNNTVRGSTGRPDDQDVAIDVLREKLYVPLDKYYLERFDQTKAKERITNLCEEVIAAYREMLQGEEWLSEETRKFAIDKLDAMKINAVYPEKWLDYSDLDLSGLTYFECREALERRAREDDMKRVNGKVDNDYWDTDILMVNAYENHQKNSINIILGILGGDFYREDMSDEELFGGIGMVIGHEISHAFDTDGAQFDKNGNVVNWWTDEDRAAFGARADKLIAYFDGITAWEDHKVTGETVQTEAIADMGGMKVMMQLASKREGFDYQKFFRSYATIWKELSTREYELNILQADVHPLSYLRTNVTVQQFDEFMEAFDVKEGDKMYLAPEDRVQVW